MRFNALLAGLVLFSLFAPSAYAQEAGRWSALAPEKGLGTGVCDKPRSGQVCLALQCGRNRGLEWSLTSNYNAFRDAERVTIAVDGEAVTTFDVLESASHVAFDASEHSRLLDRLRAGRRAAVVATGTAFPLSLSGSSKEIDRVLSACSRKREALAAGIDTFGRRAARYDDEATMTFPPETETYEGAFKRHPDLDIWGNDLRSGLDDPLLQAMTLNQCETLCSLTKDCIYYTHNGRTNTCFLKTAVGKVASYRGATTGEFQGSRINLYPPPTRGPGLVIDPDLSLRADDTTESWQRRLRASASRTGGTCEAELGAMEQAASGIVSGIEGDGVRVGDAVTFTWSGNRLEERIPLWLVVSSDAPVRFSGSGFFALGPETPNPFGIGFGQGKHRAFVALFARGAGFEGQFDIAPLEAGTVSIETALVGYLRRCQSEEVLARSETRIEVAPGAATLVLNNELGRRAYTHEVVIEKHGRRVLLNDTRILILDTADGSEIVERAGRELSFSPTHRFAVVKHDGNWEVIDVIDGATVTRARDVEIMWAPGDSFMLTTAAPWGEVNIHSTFWDGINVVEQVTGPSCCAADPDGTRIGIDIENATLQIWGAYGWMVAALQNPQYVAGENAGSAYGSGQTGHDGAYHHTMNSMGPVAPTSLARQWSASGRIQTMAGYQDNFEPSEGIENRAKSDEAVRATRLARADLTARIIRESETAGPDESAPNPVFADTLSRMGIQLADHAEGEVLLAAPGNENAFEIGMDGQERIGRAKDLMDTLRGTALEADWYFDWTVPAEDGPIPECDHIEQGKRQSLGEEEGNYVTNDVIEINRVAVGSQYIWVTRSDCIAGATFGSLRGQSALHVFDLGKPFTGSTEQVVAASNGYLVNNRQKAFFENELRVRAAGDLLLIYAPGAGVISVYDRNRRDFIWIGEGLPDGDLLKDAFLTEDLNFAVQGNSDGGVHIHRISDGRRVLSGRIVDGELAIWLDDFRFDATAEAASLVDLRFPGKEGQYSLDRFGSAKRVAGLAGLVLSGDGVPEAADAGIPPDLEGGVTPGPDGTIDLRVDRVTGEPAAINLFQDGVLTDTVDLTKRTEKQYRFERVKGARWISAVASDADGLVSLPVSADMGAPARDTAVNRALVVGINTYEDPAIPSLNYALRDGGRFAEALASLAEDAGGFDDVSYLKDRRATPDAIVAGVEALLDGLEKGDHAVLFFAGHGFRSRDGTFHFGTSATRLDAIEESALAFERISRLLEMTEARITVILDACHSGATGSSAFATNDEVVTDLASLKSNITILAASKGRESSQESSEAGGGIFTFALSRVLAEDRGRHDLNGNGRIEASELYIGVKSIVVSARKGQQTPWMVRSRMVGDYALF